MRCVGRIGLGIILPSLKLGAVRRLTLARISHGSSTINLLRQLGGAEGVSLAGIVLEWRLQVHADAPIRGLDETFALLGLICAFAVIAGWRMEGKPQEARPSELPASSHQPGDLT